jgi:uncharacterized protein YjbJ (UPF0337 family)
MNTDMIEGNWTQLKGKVRETWGKLTDDDVELIGGKRDQLLGKIQERYGRSKEDIANEIANFERKMRNEDWHNGNAPT